eukprot:GFYU01058879.1.p2 GENE.GFYU01058879.1~~GFYU01058879.1.p2  ORF type:complete len:214 (+),score=35.99 GFYU01058879.1:138-779(+)
MQVSVRMGDESIVEMLVADGRVHPLVGLRATMAPGDRKGRSHERVVDTLLRDDRMNTEWAGDGLNALLLAACERADGMTVSRLLTHPRVDPSYEQDKPLQLATMMGNAEPVEALLRDDRVNPRVCDDLPLRLAVAFGREGCVRVLLGDGRCDASAVLVSACEDGKMHSVRLMVGLGVDPSANDNAALRAATEGHMEEIVEFLMSDSRVTAALR